MPVKAPRYCARCRTAHTDVCPLKPTHNWEPKRSRSGRGGRPWERTREAIFSRDDYLCQEHLRRGEYVVVSLHGDHVGHCDHIVPLEEGGTDDDDNLQTLCGDCHTDKTSKEAARGRKKRRSLP